MVLRMRASHEVFVKGVYTEDVDVKEGKDAEPLRQEEGVAEDPRDHSVRASSVRSSSL
jgi:hypothetical protein